MDYGHDPVYGMLLEKQYICLKGEHIYRSVIQATQQTKKTIKTRCRIKDTRQIYCVDLKERTTLKKGDESGITKREREMPGALSPLVDMKVPSYIPPVPQLIIHGNDFINKILKSHQFQACSGQQNSPECFLRTDHFICTGCFKTLQQQTQTKHQAVKTV